MPQEISGQYNPNGPTWGPGEPAVGEQIAIQVDSQGRLVTAGGGGADGSTVTVGSTTGSLIQGIYQATATTVADGKAGIVRISANRAIKTDADTLLAGEDLTVNVLKTEQRFSYAYCVADTQIKAGAGFVHTLTISPIDAAATAGTIFLYDALTETTPTIFSYTIPAAALVPVTVILDVSFSTGLYLGFTTTADVSVTVSYR